MKLAVDIGGTFTDLVLEGSDSTSSTKVLTTHDAPERGVLEGVSQLLEQSQTRPTDISLVIHGTTLATNALIERKGAKTALIVTAGFRDSLEIAHEHRFEQYDLYMVRPDPLVPRSLRLTVPERMAADGSVLMAVDEEAVRALVPRLQSAGIESVGICFLHSYINADHEQLVGQILQSAMPELSITLSCVVCPEIREYERMSTTCANAYIQPLMAGYLRKLEAGLTEIGTTCPMLLMMSSGGTTTVDTAVAQPVRLIESGPAGGVIFGQSVAAECGVQQALSFDMGGTTAKLTLIDDLTPQFGRTIEVARQYRFLKGSGLPIRIPVIDMVEIGAGGGSIARIDELKRITIGPDSAGSMPGPACYDLGGSLPTVTDGDLVMGRLDPENFAGGKITLNTHNAKLAIDAAIGTPLGVDSVIAAAGISEIVDESMASAARVHAVEHGKDTAKRTLIATGGAAPLHCARLAVKLGIDDIIVPVGAGVGSAHGFLRAPIAYEVVRTRLRTLDQIDAQALSAMFVEMRAEAEAVVRLGAPDAPVVEAREAFMRYRGQGHEIAVSLPVRAYGASFDEELREWFEAQYARVFGRIVPGLQVEALTWCLTLSTESVSARLAETPVPHHNAISAGEREIFDPGIEQLVNATVYDRSTLSPGTQLSGPVVIVETETATVVPTGFLLTVSAPGHLMLTRQDQSA